MTPADPLLALASRSVTSQALTERCLAAARDPAGEGSRTYTELFADEAQGTAREADLRLAGAASPRALEGLPISVKDLFDVAGTVTRAASRALDQAPAAAADAEVVGRLRAAGAVLLGKTNMTEFAYSGLGLNPHFGTPRNSYDRATGRIPGGSSSGAAVSVSDAMALAAVGSDTGGSVRIPAALCGLVGWKPTASRISRQGVYPLSTSFDSIGPIAANVATCAWIDRVLSGERRPDESIRGATRREVRRDLRGVRLAIPGELLAADTDAAVARAIGRALGALSRAGAVLEELPLPEIVEVPKVGAGVVIVGSEAYAWHRLNLAKHGSLYDPRVRLRLERGAGYSAWEYLEALDRRAASIGAAERALDGFDGWLMPTVPVIAPPLADLAEEQAYLEANKLLLRNTSIVNFLGGCAISLPCHSPGEPPVGLSLAALAGTDHRVLELASALECILDEAREPGRA